MIGHGLIRDHGLVDLGHVAELSRAFGDHEFNLERHLVEHVHDRNRHLLRGIDETEAGNVAAIAFEECHPACIDEQYTLKVIGPARRFFPLVVL